MTIADEKTCPYRSNDCQDHSQPGDSRIRLPGAGLEDLPVDLRPLHRKFTRENVRQLTVHHKDHNHDNNPSDGSNWELLCLYCHDNEHSRELEADAARAAGLGNNQKQAANHATAQPFANLKALLNKGKSQ